MNLRTFILSLLLTAASLLAADSPLLIPFQGRLTNQAGEPYQTGQFTVTFNLYDQAIGGTSLWTERHEKVSVINGTVNAFLGSISSLASVDFATTKYLGIAIDADDNPATPEPEMVPRTMIIPAFHAKQAEYAADADKLDGHGWDVLFGQQSPDTGTIDGDKITDASITADQLADASVNTTEIADASITEPKLADDSVAARSIADGAVGTDQIQDASVTGTKLSAGAARESLEGDPLVTLGAKPIRFAGSVDVSRYNGQTYTVPAGMYARVKFVCTSSNSGVYNAEIRYPNGTVIPWKYYGSNDSQVQNQPDVWIPSGSIITNRHTQWMAVFGILYTSE